MVRLRDMNARIKKTFFALALAGATLLALAACLEVGLRLKSKAYMARLARGEIKSGIVPAPDGLYYTLKPHFEDGGIRFNAEGLNMRERPIDKPAGSFRILVVGDSVTQGVGAERTEEAFPNQMDAILGAKSGGRVECWNGGVGGYNIDQIFAYLKAVAPRFQPDLVLYAFNFNDYWDPNYYYEGQAAGGPVTPAAGRTGTLDLLKKSHAVLYLRDLYRDLHFRVRGYAPVYVDRKVNYPSWQRIHAVMREMRDWTEDRGGRFGVIILPPEQYLHTDASDQKAGMDLLAHLQEAGIRSLDLKAALLPRRDEQLFLPDGNHMNARGYRAVAEAACEWLANSQAVPTEFLSP